MDFDKIEKWVELVNKVDRDKLHMVLEFAKQYLDEVKPEIIEALRCKAGDK